MVFLSLPLLNRLPCDKHTHLYKRQGSTISGSTLSLSTVAPVDAPSREQLSSSFPSPTSRSRAFLFTRVPNLIAVLRNYGAPVAL